jgi:elongation factor 1-alpha
MSDAKVDRREGKQHVSVVICGHVDAGKSTTTGRLIFELGDIDQRAMDKLRAEAEAQGKGSFAFAFYMDTQKEERERGVTIACTTKEFFTPKYHYTIIDAPGHRDFIKNMISGASQADVALLMVPADGNFTTSIAKGDHKAGVVPGQSRQHCQLLKLIGVRQIAVGVNKMDAKLAEYKQPRYNEIRDEVAGILHKCKWVKKKEDVAKQIPIIPISGWLGDNLLKKSDNMPWWDGVTVENGVGEKVKITTLLDMFNDFVALPPRDLKKKFRMPVSGVYKIKGVGDVITGRIEQGTISKCEKGTATEKQMVCFVPSHTSSLPCEGKVFSIEMHHQVMKGGAAGPGDNVGLNVKGLATTNLPRTGDVMIIKDPADKLHATERFTVAVQCMENMVGKKKVGYSPIGFVRTGRSACKIAKIVWRKGKKSTANVKVNDPVEIQKNDTAVLEMEPLTPFVVASFKECEGLGRIAFLEGNSLVMMGNISACTYNEAAGKAVKGKK